ncbi:UDP-glucose--hexose-1-phosphate uridylyltransferase [Methanosalsum zhilinae DSM 4017]|uniref:UDP-glucose--hexose-1-phosphate uridylyltransferase n=1 Tax=Methanosalsum zhilinae (strain DSM 4017 / NBRC 107636 / OCM 62 / WeN5) TaxID=679901 RepID=F7XNH4_METZD|nr:DUF4931 domain-containing protein [Methanosalsum zhilinae]AEH61230.1 UDP-glucose--hexose-1-phosphate uridylyltransferase [Methanosalsum zhilinae DSM 4017]
MSEIRKHYFLDKYCLIAAERHKRPSDFKLTEKHASSSNCVFCPGNEKKTPPPTAVYYDGEVFSSDIEKSDKGWDIRCFPNLYPALSSEKPRNAILSSHPWKGYEGYGYHEVIVETPSHTRTINDYSDEEITMLMHAYRDRIKYYQSQSDIEYVSLFKNWGDKAGASIEHSHSQLIALPLVPPIISEELRVIDSLEECPYCNIVTNEQRSKRIVYENSQFAAIAPYYSIVPYEIWILPKNHINHISEADNSFLVGLGDAIRYIIIRYEQILDLPSYNYMFYESPKLCYHFNVRIQPVLATPGGFEKNTEIYINSMPPELAASHLK